MLDLLVRNLTELVVARVNMSSNNKFKPLIKLDLLVQNLTELVVAHVKHVEQQQIQISD